MSSRINRGRLTLSAISTRRQSHTTRLERSDARESRVGASAVIPLSILETSQRICRAAGANRKAKRAPALWTAAVFAAFVRGWKPPPVSLRSVGQRRRPPLSKHHGLRIVLLAGVRHGLDDLGPCIGAPDRELIDLSVVG